jgi:hypothetical protein
MRESMTQRASEEASSSTPVIPSGMNYSCGGHCAPSTSGVEGDGDRPTPFPFSTGPARRMKGEGMSPKPPAPSAAVTGRGEHTSPPLAVVTGEPRRRRVGPAGREREERRGEGRRAP